MIKGRTARRGCSETRPSSRAAGRRAQVLAAQASERGAGALGTLWWVLRKGHTNFPDNLTIAHLSVYMRKMKNWKKLLRLGVWRALFKTTRKQKPPSVPHGHVDDEPSMAGGRGRSKPSTQVTRLENPHRFLGERGLFRKTTDGDTFLEPSRIRKCPGTGSCSAVAGWGVGRLGGQQKGTRPLSDLGLWPRICVCL